MRHKNHKAPKVAIGAIIAAGVTGSATMTASQSPCAVSQDAEQLTAADKVVIAGETIDDSNLLALVREPKMRLMYGPPRGRVELMYGPRIREPRVNIDRDSIAKEVTTIVAGVLNIPATGIEIHFNIREQLQADEPAMDIIFERVEKRFNVDILNEERLNILTINDLISIVEKKQDAFFLKK